MAQKKGQTGNPNGRPKGIPNKTSKELREAINLIVSKNIQKLEADIKSLEPRDRLMYIEKLLKYVVPPMQAEPIEEVKPQPINTFQYFLENYTAMNLEKIDKAD